MQLVIVGAGGLGLAPAAGDRVAIYLPMIPEAAVAMLGFRVGEPRLPLVPATDAVKQELEREMRALGLLGGS